MTNKMNTIISVIVPFYKGNKYISGLVEVIQKNRKHLIEEMNAETEIIIVNDSPEETISLSEELKENVIILRNKKNQGVHQSRVNGLNAACGKYILFLDQDDLITEEALISQLKAIGNSDLVIGNGYKTDKKNKYKLFVTKKEQTNCLSIDYYCFYGSPIISPGQVLIKKDSIPNEWKTNIIKHNGADDTYLWILFLLKGSKITLNGSFVYTHSYTGENASLNSTIMDDSVKEMIECLNGTISKNKLFAIKRRSEYYSKYQNTLLYKLKYFDVCILRIIYGNKKINGIQ